MLSQCNQNLGIQLHNLLSWRGPMKAIQSNCPVMNRVTYSQTMLLSAPSSLTLDVSRVGAPTNSLGNLFHPCCKKHFPYIQAKSLIFWFETISPCPIITDSAKESFPFFLIAPKCNMAAYLIVLNNTLNIKSKYRLWKAQ